MNSLIKLRPGYRSLRRLKGYLRQIRFPVTSFGKQIYRSQITLLALTALQRRSYFMANGNFFLLNLKKNLNG